MIANADCDSVCLILCSNGVLTGRVIRQQVRGTVTPGG